MQSQHTPEQIDQLKTNARFILDHFDKAADVSKYPSIFTIISMMVVCGSAYAGWIGFLTVYVVLMGILAVVTVNSWNIITNVYKLHTKREVIDKQSDIQLSALYASILKNYKNAGFIVFTTIIEVFFIMTYNDEIELAFVWCIICVIPAISAIMCRDKYNKITKVYEYAVENS